MEKKNDTEKLVKRESKNRKLLKVLGVVEFICVAFLVAIGIVILVADNAAEVAAAADVASPVSLAILFFVLAAIGVVEGILMFRCAKDGRKSTLLIIFAAISVVSGLISFGRSGGGVSNILSGVFSVALDILVIVTALQLRKLDTLRAEK